MDPGRLPPLVREKYERALRGRHAHFAEILLQKYAAATTDAERARAEKSIVALGSGSSTGLWWGMGAFVALMVGLPLYLVYRHDQAVEEGARAVARVTRLEEGFCWFGSEKSECMELTVEVLPQAGSPYEAQFTHDIGLQWMSRVQPGSYVTVAVDRTDPKVVYLNEDALSEAAPKPPGE